MRESTLFQIEDAVATLENNFLNPWNNEEEQPMTLEEALKYVWYCFNEQMDNEAGKSRAVRFDGNKVIQEEMIKQILKNEYIKIK